MTLTREQLAEYERVTEAATKGPWFVAGPPWNHGEPYVIAGSEDPHYGTFIADLLSITEDPDGPESNRQANAEFIAAAREAMPELIREVMESHAHRAALADRVRALEAQLVQQPAEGTDQP